MSTRRVSTRQIEAAINTLGQLSTEDHDQLDGKTRDEIGHVIYTLEEILDAR